jgi:hypothetical protein
MGENVSTRSGKVTLFLSLISPLTFSIQDAITYLLGSHRARGYHYDIPTYLAESISARGPVHMDFECPDTNPDRIVDCYLSDWWNAKDMASIVDTFPKWSDVQEDALLIHSKFVS